VICTSTETSDAEVEKYANSNNILVFRGSLENKLKRWKECANFLNIEKFHTVDVDDPFFDSVIIKESMDLLFSENLDVVFPTTESSGGSASVGYSINTKYLNNVFEKNLELKEVEMVDAFFLNDRDIKAKKLNSRVPDLSRIRLTLDYEEDYHLLIFVLRMLGPYCKRSEIIKLFNKNPNLYKINWFRNEEWAAKQAADRLTTMKGMLK
jgi:spore coat polysaccharide biosynthesis protein SpsF (cytidylyltransferase family)